MLDTLTNQDLFILGFLLVLIAIVGIICLFMALFKKKDIKDTKKEKEPDIKVALATDNIPEISDEAPNMEELLNVVEELDKKTEKVEEKTLVEELEASSNDIEDEVVVIPDNIEVEQIEKAQEEKTRSSIEDVLKAMNADLEKQKYEKIEEYEEEQEENAVISYQELLDRKMALNNESYEVKAVEPVVSPKPAYERDTKFSNSEFISPIFGRVDKKEEKTFEPVREVEKEESEVDEFLSSLKEFRNNL